jgi:colicin import membrane protein
MVSFIFPFLHVILRVICYNRCIILCARVTAPARLRWEEKERLREEAAEQQRAAEQHRRERIQEAKLKKAREQQEREEAEAAEERRQERLRRRPMSSLERLTELLNSQSEQRDLDYKLEMKMFDARLQILVGGGSSWRRYREDLERQREEVRRELDRLNRKQRELMQRMIVESRG